MASTGPNWLIFTVICVCVGSASSFVSLEVKARNTAQYGRHSMVECTVKITKDVDELVIYKVIWRKAEKTLLCYNVDGFKEDPRFQFAEPSWNNKNPNVSLLITNTKVTDAGEYICIVMLSSGTSKMSTILDVAAKYNTPTIQSSPTKIIPDTDFTLRCQSKGGYPQGQLRWFDEDQGEWTKSSQMDATQMEDGLYSLSSELSVLRGSVLNKYICALYNATGDREGEALFDVNNALPQSGAGKRDGDARPAAGVVAPLVVIGSLIVGLLLLVLMLYRRKLRQERRRNSTVPLMGGNRSIHIEESCVEEGEMDKFSTESNLREAAE